MDKAMFLRAVSELQQSYRPSAETLAHLAQVDLVAVVGPTGVGKSTMTHRAGIPYILSDVTRPPRSGEVDGVDYNFRADLNALLTEIQSGQFVQYVVERNGEFYGTRASSYPAEGPCAMSVIATAMPTFKVLGFHSVRPVFIVPPSHTEWMHRISSHRDKDLEGRLLEAKESLSIALTDPMYTFLLNDNLEEAVVTLKNIAAGKTDAGLSVRARNAANELYSHLQKLIR
jgi:guanylate kinase